MNKSAETLKYAASFFAWTLLMERFPLKTSDTRPRRVQQQHRPVTLSQALDFLVLEARKRRVVRSHYMSLREGRWFSPRGAQMPGDGGADVEVLGAQDERHIVGRAVDVQVAREPAPLAHVVKTLHVE